MRPAWPSLNLGLRSRSFSLLETGGANQLASVNDLAAAAWVKNNLDDLQADVGLSPAGTMTADRLRRNGIPLTSVGVFQDMTVGGVAIGESMSVFAKAETCTKIALMNAVAAGSYAQFDLIAGTIIGSGSCAPSIEAYGNGWFRCSTGAVTSAGQYYILQMLDASVAGNPWVTGNCASGNSVLVWQERLWLP